MLFGEDVIAVLHKLEQVSSDQHVGTASENLMEALRQNQTSKVGPHVDDQYRMIIEDHYRMNVTGWLLQDDHYTGTLVWRAVGTSCREPECYFVLVHVVVTLIVQWRSQDRPRGGRGWGSSPGYWWTFFVPTFWIVFVIIRLRTSEDKLVLRRRNLPWQSVRNSWEHWAWL